MYVGGFPLSLCILFTDAGRGESRPLIFKIPNRYLHFQNLQILNPISSLSKFAKFFIDIFPFQICKGSLIHTYLWENSWSGTPCEHKLFTSCALKGRNVSPVIHQQIGLPDVFWWEANVNDVVIFRFVPCQIYVVPLLKQFNFLHPFIQLFFYSFMYILSILRGADFNNVIFRFDRYYIFVPQFATFAEKYHMVESTGIVLPRIYGWLASGSGPTRFLEVAKSYGGQFRSIWEHCLLYSNGSTDGDVNKSIEICLTRMVRGRPSRRT